MENYGSTELERKDSPREHLFEIADDIDDDDEYAQLINTSNRKNFKKKSLWQRIKLRFPRSERPLYDLNGFETPTNLSEKSQSSDYLPQNSGNKNSFILFKFFPNLIENPVVNRLLSSLPIIKISLLSLYGLICIIILSMYGEDSLNYKQIVLNNKLNSYNSIKLKDNNENINYKSKFIKCYVQGPFLDLQESKEQFSGVNIVQLKLFETGIITNSSLVDTLLSTWTIYLREINKDLTYEKLTHLEHVFQTNKEYSLRSIEFKLSTTSNQFIGINFVCKQLSNIKESETTLAILLLLLVYSLIIFELIHRTLAAWLGSIGGLAMLTLVNMERPKLEDIVNWVEWETIMLICGMMIIVAIFCETGLFDWIAAQIFRYFGNRIWMMIGALCLLSGILSAFLDNVTTILLVTPITIKLSEVLNLDPRHLLIGEVIFSNIGGTSTAIGDPPNVILTANNYLSTNGIDFTSFTVFMLVGSIFVYIVAFIHFRLIHYGSSNFNKISDELAELKKEIKIWKRTYNGILPLSKEERIVKTLLKEKVSQLQNIMQNEEFKNESNQHESFLAKSANLIQTYRVNNYTLLIKSSILFIATLLLFFLNPFIDKIHFTIGLISILSAILLMTLTIDNIDFESILHKIEWSTLLFFAGLFIFMRCIEELNLLYKIGSSISDVIIGINNKSDRLVIALLIIILVSSLVSSIIDNIPFTTAMIPIIIQLNQTIELPLRPMTYALAFGSCLGGNGSLVGASCNLVAAGISEQHGYKITFKDFFKTAFPIMITSVLTALVYICITCVYLKWY